MYNHTFFCRDDEKNATAILFQASRFIDAFCSDQNSCSDAEVLSALLLIESLLRTNVLQPEVHEKLLEKQLSMLLQDQKPNISPSIAIKSKKILLTIKSLIKQLQS